MGRKMIQKIVIGKLVDFIAKKFKLDKILKYVEDPNDADDRIDKLETTVFQLSRMIEILLKDSNPKRDFVVCYNCKNKQEKKNEFRKRYVGKAQG